MRELESVVREAGRILLRYFRRSDLQTEYKSLRDLVSEADMHAEEFLMEKLDKIDPVSFLSEESSPGMKLGDSPLWIVDPLDGTTNFLAGITPFAVSVAHYDGERMDAAACYIPILDEFFYAERGRGSSMNGETIEVSTVKNPMDAVAATGFACVTKGLEKNNIGVFNSVVGKTRAVRRLGSAVTDLLYTADGRFDFFWEYGLGPWDIAAGSLILEEAGGIVTDFDGGTDYVRMGSVIASNRELYEFIRGEIESNFK